MLRLRVLIMRKCRVIKRKQKQHSRGISPGHVVKAATGALSLAEADAEDT
jgi:hypothetical protein